MTMTQEDRDELVSTIQQGTLSEDGVKAYRSKLALEILPVWLDRVEEMGKEVSEKFRNANPTEADHARMNDYLNGVTFLAAELAVTATIAAIPVQHLSEAAVEELADNMKEKYAYVLQTAITFYSEEDGDE